MGEWMIDIELQEPCSFGARPDVSNEIDTLDFVPSTALRGAIASVVARSGGAGALGTLFGPDGSKRVIKPKDRSSILTEHDFRTGCIRKLR